MSQNPRSRADLSASLAACLVASLASFLASCADSHTLLLTYSWEVPYDPSVLTISVDHRGISGATLTTRTARQAELSVSLPGSGARSVEVLLVSGTDTLAEFHGQVSVRSGYDGALTITAGPLPFRPLGCYTTVGVQAIRHPTRVADSLFVTWGQRTPELAGVVC